MLKSLKNQVLIEYRQPDSYSEGNYGITLPSQAEIRNFLKKQGTKEFSEDKPPPDIVRQGILIDGECEAPIGSFIYFNKHDADQFQYDDKTYYRTAAKWVLAYIPVLSTDPKMLDKAQMVLN